MFIFRQDTYTLWEEGLTRLGIYGFNMTYCVNFEELNTDDMDGKLYLVRLLGGQSLSQDDNAILSANIPQNGGKTGVYI